MSANRKRALQMIEQHLNHLKEEGVREIEFDRSALQPAPRSAKAAAPAPSAARRALRSLPAVAAGSALGAIVGIALGGSVGYVVAGAIIGEAVFLLGTWGPNDRSAP